MHFISGLLHLQLKDFPIIYHLLIVWRPPLNLFDHAPSSVTLAALMLFPFHMQTLLVFLVFAFQLHFNWGISLESSSLSVFHRLAHDIQQRNWSPQLPPCRLDMVEVLSRQEKLFIPEIERDFMNWRACVWPAKQKMGLTKLGHRCLPWCTKIEYIQLAPFVVWCLSTPMITAIWWCGIKSKQWQGHIRISYVYEIPLKR